MDWANLLQMTSWIFFMNSGVGPMQGQANHFTRVRRSSPSWPLLLILLAVRSRTHRVWRQQVPERDSTIIWRSGHASKGQQL